MRPILAALLVVLALPANAAASSVTYTPPYMDPPGTEPEESCSRYAQCPPSTLEIAGAPGEANRFEVVVEPTQVIVRDAGAALQASSGCSRDDDGSVRCPRTEYASVKAGDGNDEVTVGAGFVGTVAGEAGNDVLSGSVYMDGGPGDDVLNGTPGNDTLSGGPGADRVMAGAGADRVTEESTQFAADVIDGGPGTDLLWFYDRRAGVTVDLGRGAQSAGSPGEDNVVGGVEQVTGGHGDDVVILRAGLTSDRPRVEGGPGDDLVVTHLPADVSADTGNDTVIGSRGDDTLSGGAGADIIRGGRGNDTIQATDRRRDIVDCGRGRDRLAADRRDVRRGCELR